MSRVQSLNAKSLGPGAQCVAGDSPPFLQLTEADVLRADVGHWNFAGLQRRCSEPTVRCQWVLNDFTESSLLAAHAALIRSRVALLLCMYLSVV